MYTTNTPQGYFTPYIFAYLLSGMDLRPSLTVRPLSFPFFYPSVSLWVSETSAAFLHEDGNMKSYTPRDEPKMSRDHRENYVYFNYRQRFGQIVVKHISQAPR